MDRIKYNIIQDENKTMTSDEIKPTPVEWIIGRWVERGTLDHNDINKAKLMEREMIGRLRNKM